MTRTQTTKEWREWALDSGAQGEEQRLRSSHQHNRRHRHNPPISHRQTIPSNRSPWFRRQ